MEKEKKTKSFIKAVPIVIKIVIVIAILLGVFYLGNACSSVINLQTKSTKFGLKDVGELVTQTAYVTVVTDNKENKELFNKFEIPFTESRQVFSYDVEVDVSVNFSEISYTVDSENKEIKVSLPHSKIYKTTLNTDSLKVYLDTESLFSRIDLKEHNDALNAIKEQAATDAKSNGTLEAGDNNAKRLVESFIKENSRYKDYSFSYEYIGE